jgi:hypothetical protein
LIGISFPGSSDATNYNDEAGGVTTPAFLPATVSLDLAIAEPRCDTLSYSNEQESGMAEEKPSIHIDTDWKRQAQEEKKRLVEEEARKARESAAAAPPATAGPSSPRSAAAPGRPRGELPPASFPTLVQSILTQVLYYLGDLTTRGSEPNVNLDMAKHQIDILGVLEEKTRGNLTPEEKSLLDTALYETRMRYVSVASQFT